MATLPDGREVPDTSPLVAIFAVDPDNSLQLHVENMRRLGPISGRAGMADYLRGLEATNGREYAEKVRAAFLGKK